MVLGRFGRVQQRGEISFLEVCLGKDEAAEDHCRLQRKRFCHTSKNNFALLYLIFNLGLIMQVLDKFSPPDHYMPESYTCFFLLKLPRYSCKVRKFAFALFNYLVNN